MRVGRSMLAVTCVVLAGCGSSGGGLQPARDLAFAIPPGNAAADTATGYTVTFTIGETSPDDAGVAGVSWALTKDGVAYLSGTTGRVVANRTLLVSIPITETVAGDHEYVLTIDSRDVIVETDESNNTAAFTVSWTSSG